MSDGELRGSDFMYIALGGIAVYAAYQFFKSDGGVFGKTAQTVTTTPAILNDGIFKTGSAAGDSLLYATPAGVQFDAVKDSTNYLMSAWNKLFPSKTQNVYTDPYIPGVNNFSTKSGPIFVPTTGQIPNFSSASGASVYVAPPTSPTGKTTTSSAPLYSTQPKVGKTSTTPGQVSSNTVVGAKAGTVFSSGSSVKSTGASGKYKTTL